MYIHLFVHGLLGLFVYLLFATLYRAASSPLRQVPGPWVSRFTRLPFLVSVWRGQAHKDTIALHRKYAPAGSFYAPVVRLGPGMYSITTPERAVYGVGSKFSKGPWYQGWNLIGRTKRPGTIFTTIEADKHADRRKRLASLYSMSSMLRLEPHVQSTLDVFVERLDEIAALGKEVDLFYWLQCFAADVIGSITYSRRFGFLDSGVDIEKIMETTYDQSRYSSIVSVYARQLAFFLRQSRFLPLKAGGARRYLVELIQRSILEREGMRQAGSKSATHTPRDMLDMALDAEEDSEKKMTRFDIFGVGIMNLFAGSSTVAVSLASVLFHLASTPRTMEKLRKELDEAGVTAQKGHVPFKESQESLPYLQASIKEALRLCGAVGLPLWREVPKGGVQMLGHYFPEGTEIGLNCWVPHRNEDSWGPDAKDFRPERWIEASDDTERLKRMYDAFMPYGLGSRTCIGKNLAHLELCRVIPMIVSRFDLEVAAQEGEFEAESSSFAMTPTNFRVVLRKRSWESSKA